MRLQKICQAKAVAGLITALTVLMSGCGSYPTKFSENEKPAILKIEPPLNADVTSWYTLSIFKQKTKCRKGIAEIKLAIRETVGFLEYKTKLIRKNKFPEQVLIPTDERLLIFLFLDNADYFKIGKECGIGVRFKPEPGKIYSLKTGNHPTVGIEGYCSMELYEITSDNERIPARIETTFESLHYSPRFVKNSASHTYICHEDGTYEPAPE